MTGSGVTNLGFCAGDFDGDGKSDFVQSWKNGNSIALSVFKSNGSSFAPYGTWTMPVGYSTLKILPVDIDGDGKTDIARVWNNNGKLAMNIFKSTGSSYSSSFATTFNEGSGNLGFIPCDYDGDGKTDIIQFWNNGGFLGVIVYKSTGTSYYAAASWTLQESSTNVGFANVDFNGDAKEEFIQGWNSNNYLSIITFYSSGTNINSYALSYPTQGYQNLGLLPIKFSGSSKTGFVQVFNNNNKSAFIKYEPINY